jgi:hypothetical protein
VPFISKKEKLDYVRQFEELLEHNCFLNAEMNRREADFKGISKPAFGEYSFHQQVKDVLKSGEFLGYHFFSNLYIPAETSDHNQRMYENQIDHLLVCPHGVFAFNTKCWNGVAHIWPSDLPFSPHGIIPGFNGVSAVHIKPHEDSGDTWHCSIYEYGSVKQIINQATNLQALLRIVAVDFVVPVLSFALGDGKEAILYDKDGTPFRSGLFNCPIGYVKSGRLLMLTFHLGTDYSRNDIAESKRNIEGFLRSLGTTVKYTPSHISEIVAYLIAHSRISVHFDPSKTEEDPSLYGLAAASLTP